MSSAIRANQQTLLAMRSGGVCARCRHPLTVDATEHDGAQHLGQAAHIKGEKPGSARYDPNQPDTERNLYANLLYTCGGCHTLIDKQSSTFTVEDLLEMKDNHEVWVHAQLSEGITTVGFTELDLISKALLSKPHDSTLDFMVLGPEAKMDRNDLGVAVLDQLKMGYGKAPEVKSYIAHMVVIDNDFPERLKSGFVEQYDRLRADGFAGDVLFFALRDFASKGSVDFREQAAALSILAYLFQNCEVFEH
jgi:hypothetical protein